MKRHRFQFLVVIFLLSIIELSFAQAPIDDDETSKLLPSFYQLWKDSSFGNDPNRTERAAWIIRKDDGTFEFYRWPTSGAWAGEVWVGPLPKNVIGQVHTHPTKRDPKPSLKDRNLAKRKNIPLYTISSEGVWRVLPDREPTRVVGRNWYSELRHKGD
jgi:hypothetical protein